MTARREEVVARPLKKAEYVIRFGNRTAEAGWRDLCAVARNATVDAWTYLTETPLTRCDRCYPLQADYATLTVAGTVYARWQYKITNGGRIWYWVADDPSGKRAGVVYLELCSAGHPKGTEPR